MRPAPRLRHDIPTATIDGKPGSRRLGTLSATLVRRARHGLAALLAATSLGCLTITSEVPQTQVATPSTWQQQPEGLSSGQEHPNPDLSTWWTQLEDDTLSELINEALAASPDLRSAVARLRQARARRFIAGTDLFPTVSTSITRSTSRRSVDGGTSGTTHLYDAGFDASWEPDIFGANRGAVRAAQADVEASEADLHDVQVSLVAEVALGYVELRSFQARLEIARENLARQAETFDLVSWRAQAGLTSELDVEQARTNLEQTRSQLPGLQTGMVEAEHRLEVLLAQTPGALHETLATPVAIPRAPQDLVLGIPAQALESRPDVRAARQRLVAETARLDEADAARYPSLSLSGSIGLEALSLDSLTSADTIVSSVLGRLTAPIFDRRRILRQIDIQSASQELALAALEKTILTALAEVEGSLTSLAGARNRHSALTAASQSARASARLARQQYAAGLASYQSVLDTERTLLSIDDSLRSSEAEATTAVIRLYKALGGGWSRDATVESNSMKRSEAS